MPTDIVFGGGHTITVALPIEAVRRDIEQYGMGRPPLIYELLDEKDSAGSPAKVYVNWGEIAYLREPRAKPQSRAGG